MRKSQTQLPDSPIKLREQCLSEWKKGLDRAKYKARQLVLPSPGLIQSLAGLSGPGSYTAPAAEARGCNENWSQESMWGIGLTTQYESCFIPSHQQRDCALHKNLSPTLRNSSSPTLHGSPLLPKKQTQAPHIHLLGCLLLYPAISSHAATHLDSTQTQKCLQVTATT